MPAVKLGQLPPGRTEVTVALFQHGMRTKKPALYDPRCHEDWGMLQLRFELHLLSHAAQPRFAVRFVMS